VSASPWMMPAAGFLHVCWSCRKSTRTCSSQLGTHGSSCSNRSNVFVQKVICEWMKSSY
jgi:hypothetical protein